MMRNQSALFQLPNAGLSRSTEAAISARSLPPAISAQMPCVVDDGLGICVPDGVFSEVVWEFCVYGISAGGYSKNGGRKQHSASDRGYLAHASRFQPQVDCC
jgi:hypothetical protein